MDSRKAQVTNSDNMLLVCYLEECMFIGMETNPCKTVTIIPTLIATMILFDTHVHYCTYLVYVIVPFLRCIELKSYITCVGCVYGSIEQLCLSYSVTRQVYLHSRTHAFFIICTIHH